MPENYRKVLVTAKVHPYLIEYLEEKGYQVLYHPGINNADTFEKIHSCIGLIVTTRIKVDKNLLDHAPQLQWIGRLGSGMETIDTDYAREKGIRCKSSPEGNCDAVGEQVIGMLIALFANIQRSNLQLREGKWEREDNRGIEIGEKTVGIIGYGHTGHAVARKLSGFDCKVLAYDKYKEDYGDEYAERATLEEIQQKADILTVHVPLNEETHHMINDQFLKAFAVPIYFINASRGKVAKTADVIKNIKEEQVLGACLDVLENEHPSTFSEEEKEQFNFLLNSEKVILTPHIAGYTHEAAYKMAHYVIKKLGL